MSPRDDLADWEARTDLLLASLEGERQPDLTRLERERYAAAIRLIGDAP